MKDARCLYARCENLTEVIVVGKDNQILMSFIPLKAKNRSGHLRLTSRGPEIRAGWSITEHFSTAWIEHTNFSTL